MIFTKEQKKIIMLSSLGGALEFYDFIIFVFFAKTLSDLFFPSVDPTVGLMKTFGLFAVGYLMRPLGGILFGHFGDRFGRKKTFIATVMLMAIPTFLMSLLPNYQQIGLLAPVLLVILRLLQGLSVGGEIPGAIVFISETVAFRHRGFACAIAFFGINCGMMLGSFIAAVFDHLLSAEQLSQWGWRIPFFLGGVFGLLSFYLRRNMHETPLFQAIQKNKQAAYLPIKDVIKNYWVEIGQGALLTALAATLVGLLYLFMPTYLTTYFNYPVAETMTINTVMLSVFSIIIVFIGYMADKFGYLKLLRLGALGFILLSYFAYSLFTLNNIIFVIIGTVLLSIISTLITGTFPNILVELYPTKVRYTGVALVYNLGFGVAGGLTPLIATSLIHWTHNVLAPGFYLMLIAGMAWIVSMFLKNKNTVALD